MPQVGNAQELADLTPRQNCLVADIVIATDWSGSIAGNEKFLVNALYYFIKTTYLSENGVRMGLVSFGTSAEIDARITADRSELENELSYMLSKKADGVTNLSDALRISMSELRSFDFGGNARAHSKKILIIISDGEPDDRLGAIELAKEAKSEGIQIFTISVYGASRIDHECLRSLASEQSYFESNFFSLREVFDRLGICI